MPRNNFWLAKNSFQILNLWEVLPWVLSFKIKYPTIFFSTLWRWFSYLKESLNSRPETSSMAQNEAGRLPFVWKNLESYFHITRIIYPYNMDHIWPYGMIWTISYGLYLFRINYMARSYNHIIQHEGDNWSCLGLKRWIQG